MIENNVAIILTKRQKLNKKKKEKKKEKKALKETTDVNGSTKENTKTNYFNKFPLVLFGLIFSNLSTGEIVKIQRINKHFQAVAKSSRLFKDITADLSKATDQDMSARNLLVLAAGNLQRLSLFTSKAFGDESASHKNPLCDASLSDIALSGKSLCTINLKGFPNITGESLVEYLPPTLKEFNAHGCGFDKDAVINLKLKMTDPAFKTDMRICDGCGKYEPQTPTYGCSGGESCLTKNRCSVAYCESCFHQGLHAAACTECNAFSCEECEFEGNFTTLCCDECGSNKCRICDPMTDYCEMCHEVTCMDCRPVGYCEMCNKSTCMNCKPVSFCDVCKKMACMDCEFMGYCEVCHKMTCMNCEFMGYCEVCHKMACMDCEFMGYCEVCHKMTCMKCSPVKFSNGAMCHFVCPKSSIKKSKCKKIRAETKCKKIRAETK